MLLRLVLRTSDPQGPLVRYYSSVLVRTSVPHPHGCWWVGWPVRAAHVCRAIYLYRSPLGVPLV